MGSPPQGLPLGFFGGAIPWFRFFHAKIARSFFFA
jgi:hypothetical protein